MHPQNPASPTVQPGSAVIIEITYEEDESERLELVIVADEQADFSAGFLGMGTPLAQAILGQAAGSVIPYTLGDARQVKILAIGAAGRAPEEDLAARRQETVRKAIEQSDRTSAMIFAASFSGKWGDYDPQGIEQWDNEKKEDHASPG
jgi:hypothetical protein